MVALAPSGNAENRVDIDVAKSGLVLVPYDTLFVGGEYQVRFWLENDIRLGGLNVGAQIWSEDGATWKYILKPDGIGSRQCITMVPGCRLDSNTLDMTGFLANYFSFDMIGHDTILTGGVAFMAGVPAGPSEHMFSWHFQPTGPWDPDEIHTLCFDTSHVPPGVSFCYVDMYGGAFMPLWGGRLCVPVKLLCGNPNGDNDVNVGDAVFMLNYIFREGLEPDPWQLGDANCDGALDVGDVVFLIAAAFRYGPQPECCDF